MRVDTGKMTLLERFKFFEEQEDIKAELTESLSHVMKWEEAEHLALFIMNNYFLERKND